MSKYERFPRYLQEKKCGLRVVLHTVSGQLTLLGDVFYCSLKKHAAVASSEPALLVCCERFVNGVKIPFLFFSRRILRHAFCVWCL
jgi:hypothetical protein